MNSRLVLVDGHSLLHRAYHALPRTLTTPKGNPINAVYGFTRMLLKVIKDLKPQYLAVAFDMKGPTFRHLEYEKYKEGRPEMEEDLVAQLPEVKELLRAFDIPIYEVQGFEGEDTIASLKSQISKLKTQSHSLKLKTGETEIETVIVTGDRDTLQLVDERTKVYAPLKGLSNPVMYDAKEVYEQYGLRPEQIVDYKALRGDPSDNIPGVKGIGEKTAVKLLQRFGSLEEIYRNLDKIDPKVAMKLAEEAEQAALSKRLATIVRDVPVKLDLKECRMSGFGREKAIKLFKKLGFKSLVRELEEESREDNQLSLI